MKILLVHNHYGSGSPSGENNVFRLERDLLLRKGHDVRTFERFSDEIIARGWLGAIAGAAMTPWNPHAATSLRKAISEFSPDIVHAHNTFPMISPSIFSAARGAGRVLTLHNYRLVCPAAIPMRNGRVCTKCISARSVFPSLRHGCYRASRVATAPLAANVAFNRWRGTWDNEVERFVALTDFQREKMVLGGLPREKISVKPNFYPGEPSITPFRERPQKVVFVGRISEEKGVEDLIRAWEIWGSEAPKLNIIGDGPQRLELEKRVAQALGGGLSKVSFLGQLSNAAAEKEICSARLLLLPSRWFEGFPMVLREAFAYGTPVGVSNIGPLPSLVEEAEGIVFRAQDPEDLRNQVSFCWSNEQQLSRISTLSSNLFREKYTEKVNYSKLISIYEESLQLAAQNREPDK